MQPIVNLHISAPEPVWCERCKEFHEASRIQSLTEDGVSDIGWMGNHKQENADGIQGT